MDRVNTTISHGADSWKEVSPLGNEEQSATINLYGPGDSPNPRSFGMGEDRFSPSHSLSLRDTEVPAPRCSNQNDAGDKLNAAASITVKQHGRSILDIMSQGTVQLLCPDEAMMESMFAYCKHEMMEPIGDHGWFTWDASRNIPRLAIRNTSPTYEFGTLQGSTSKRPT